MPYESIYDFNQIDLTRHGLIEASAGTGKTYTIENLVVRLLKETDVELENILLVTFTEKAASELKIRIRKKLEKELDDSKDKAKTSKKLSDTLDAFDKASIHTIHGFCQTVLRDFAFENKVLFESEVINDAPLFETLLKEQMRKDWPEIYGGDLKEILEISRFNQRKGSFSDTIINLAQFLHRAAGDRLLPDLRGRGFKEIKGETASACMEIKTLLSSEGEFSRGYAQLNFNAGAKKNILKNIVVPVEDYFEEAEENRFDIRDLSDLMTQVEDAKSGGRRGLESLVPEKWNKGGTNLEVCPNLEALKHKLEKLNIRLNDLQYTLPAETIHRLQDDVSRTKQGHGWISYYDMLSLVDKALYSDNSANLLGKLRNRFKVAFIDEFQDTDPVQWRIFRKIFIDSRDDDLQNLLFVIGDPKQAIYSFRGADVYAYLSARNEMERLEKKGRAGLYSLSVNWRSQPELITAFNTLFCGEAWFKPQAIAGEFEIGYQSTGFPEKDERPVKMIADNSGRPVLNIVDLSEAPSPRPAKPRLARFVACEIKHLISSDIRMKEKGGDECKIGFGDICILVRSRSDVPFIEEELVRQKIPYTFYKKPGLFVSDEAVYTSLLFHAILDPGDNSALKKALLTPFFGFNLTGLFVYEEMPPSHPVKEMLFKWNGYAMSQRWSRLFQSLVEDSGLLSRGTMESGWDRKYTNYQQIFEYLEEVAYRKNLDFRGLSAILDVYRNRSIDADEGVDIHQIETEARKVQIMTMHVSKGLEFPVVFVAGGLTQPASYLDKYHTYHEIKKGGLSSEIRRIVDLAKSGGGGRHESEKMDEDKRLYYVASTRAQFKLYLPFYIHETNAPWLGPVCTQLSPALLNAFPGSKADEDVVWLNADHYSGASSTQTGFEKTPRRAAIPAGEAFELLSVQESYRQRRIKLDSFSSLHQKMSQVGEGREENLSFQTEQRGKEDDEGFASPGIGAVSGERDLKEVPGGIDVGLMFHDILEHIDYGVVLKAITQTREPVLSLMHDAGTREIILGQMETHRVDVRWKDSVCRILGNTLTTPVAPVADDFILAHLKEEDRLHEVEFYYSFPSHAIRSNRVPDCETSNRFIRGFVDLVFRKDRKFYIADWKSNYLETGYNLESMEKSMAHSDYHLQYKLYAVAVLRWLKQVIGDQFNPEKDFGGVFYFYLRGMGIDEGAGIYHVPPDELGSLEQLEEEIEMILRN
jgi:exodeoxyribonuclease V beta subunit